MICVESHSSILTLNKTYEVMKSVQDSYVVKCDDGVVRRMDKGRFSNKGVVRSEADDLIKIIVNEVQ